MIAVNKLIRVHAKDIFNKYIYLYDMFDDLYVSTWKNKLNKKIENKIEYGIKTWTTKSNGNIKIHKTELFSLPFFYQNNSFKIGTCHNILKI